MKFAALVVLMSIISLAVGTLLGSDFAGSASASNSNNITIIHKTSDIPVVPPALGACNITLCLEV